MSALRSNELITKAVLTVRKAGKTPLEYLKITIEKGRVTSIAIDAGDLQQGHDVVEQVTFSFNKVTVEYVPDHGLTAEQEHRNIHKVERLSSAFYAKLQEKLLEPGE
jgi:type VI protein secretion system component Hcp